MLINRMLNIEPILTQSLNPSSDFSQCMRQQGMRSENRAFVRTFSHALKKSLLNEKEGLHTLAYFTNAVFNLQKTQGRSLDCFFRNHPKIADLFSKNIAKLEKLNGEFQAHQNTPKKTPAATSSEVDVIDEFADVKITPSTQNMGLNQLAKFEKPKSEPSKNDMNSTKIWDGVHDARSGTPCNEMGLGESILPNFSRKKAAPYNRDDSNFVDARSGEPETDLTKSFLPALK